MVQNNLAMLHELYCSTVAAIDKKSFRNDSNVWGAIYQCNATFRISKLCSFILIAYSSYFALKRTRVSARHAFRLDMRRWFQLLWIVYPKIICKELLSILHRMYRKTICTNQNNAHKYSNRPRCLFGACKKILRRATVGGSRDVFFITISPLECKFCTAVQAGGLNNSCKWVEVNSFEAAFHWNGSQSPRFPSCS